MFGLIPNSFRPWMAWLAVVVALLLAMASINSSLHAERAAHANTKAEWAQEREGYAKAVVASAEAARNEERERYEAQKEIADAANIERDEALGQLDAAKSAGDGLRTQIARLQSAITTCGGRKDSSTGKGSAATSATIDLLADVQRRLDEATNGITGFADKASIAGSACERSYDSLTR